MKNFLFYFAAVSLAVLAALPSLTQASVNLFDPEFYFDLIAQPGIAQNLKGYDSFLKDEPVIMDCNQCMAIATQAAETFQDDDAIAYMKEVVKEVCKAQTEIQYDQCVKEHSDLIDILALIAKYATTATTKLDWDARTICSTIVPVCEIDCCKDKLMPEQVRLAYSSKFETRSVTWTISTKPTAPIVYYDTDPDQTPFRFSTPAEVSTYDEGMWRGFIVKSTINNIAPNTRIYYRVGDLNTNVFSQTYSFASGDIDAGAKGKPFRFIQVADMDYTHFATNTTNAMKRLVEEGQIDMVVHVGDVGYADGYQAHWDDFLRSIEPISSRVPYMVGPGNHEFLYDFKTYKARFAMPGNTENMYYGFSPSKHVHFTMMNTETVLNTAHIDDDQKLWAVKDLTGATLRNEKWKIATGHRPFYCTSKQSSRCTHDAAHLRNMAEDIFYRGKVDMVIGGHVHSYERSYPIYKGVATATNYISPKAPVYVVNGVSGNRESLTLPKNDQPWSNAPFATRGYAVGEIEGNRFSYTFYSAATGEILDNFNIVKA